MSESNCLPKFRVLEIHVECRDVSGHRSPEAAIDWIDLKSDDIEWRISNVESKPRAALSRLHRIMDSFDPHVILTQQGDWIDMPALFNLSERVGQPLRLGRTGHDGRPRSEAFTSWSYGRLIRKEAKYSLEGRIHIVASTSFIFKEGDLKVYSKFLACLAYLLKTLPAYLLVQPSQRFKSVRLLRMEY